jgi:hypothetical protein
MEYLERIATSKIIEMKACEIFALKTTLPIFLNGHKMKPYQIEVAFRESVRKWIVKFDTLENGDEQLIVIDKKVNF